MILDHTTVITGSFNFTKAAEESNAENILILRSPQLAARYTENFLEHKLHAEPYYGK
jgi:phosphatidylserine/phosphatidylglycerophosphate/cardiolipin synthase-like enzyme